LTQEQVGERIGVSGAVVSRYESGDIVVPAERVAPLLDALGLIGEARVDVWRAIVPAGYRVGA
jgi:transcriptional regulator with XRE-family HTH domain